MRAMGKIHVGRLVILLGAGGQGEPEDVVWYSGVGLYENAVVPRKPIQS